MNIYFSKVIKAGERQREFNFRQHPHSDNNIYSIDVPDDKGQRIAFRMNRNAEGQWTTEGQDIPAWIQHAEDALNEAIRQHMDTLSPEKRR